MIARGNSKLGPIIGAWSILAGDTCPGASGPCLDNCYARKHRFKTEPVIASHTRNWRFSELDGFADRMCEKIKRARSIKTVRIHVAGDFYDPVYTEKWIEIVERSRQTAFYAYTRSWRCEDILPSLMYLAQLPNFEMWYSCDCETGCPLPTPNVRRAYMALDDGDVPPYPVDLTFRVKRNTVMKWAPDDSLVCPTENGVTKTNCSVCKLCWSTCQLPRRDAKHVVELGVPNGLGSRGPLGEAGESPERQGESRTRDKTTDRSAEEDNPRYVHLDC